MQKKVCEVCRRPYESEDHECREDMPAMDRLKGSEMDMTLRDRFALSALAALIAEPIGENYVSTVRTLSQGRKGPDAFAHVAYRIADAMLRARQKTNYD